MNKATKQTRGWLFPKKTLRYIVLSCMKTGHFSQRHSRNEIEMAHDVNAALKYDRQMRRGKFEQEYVDDIVIVSHSGFTLRINSEFFTKLKTLAEVKKHLHLNGMLP